VAASLGDSDSEGSDCKLFSQLSTSYFGKRTLSSSSDWDSSDVSSESVGVSEATEPAESSSSLDSRLALTRLCKSSSKLFRFSEDIVLFACGPEGREV
jgi:hypothetical protein